MEQTGQLGESEVARKLEAGQGVAALRALEDGSKGLTQSQ